MNLFELIFGQIPEALYFALFIIGVKQLKEKRFIFTILMILEYILLLNIFPYSIWFHILYFITYYLIMKLLYNDKCQIIDIFTLGIASLILIISCIILYVIIWFTIHNMVIYSILNRLFLFIFLFIFKNKLYKIQDIYKKLWNRNDKIKKKIKSTTFRALNLVVFNFMFYIINICMTLAIFIKEVL